VNFFDSLRPFLSRWVGSLVGVGAAWLVAKYGFNVNQQTQHDVAEVLVLLITTLVVRDSTHRAIDKKVNPGDAASMHLAVAEKAESAAIKADERATAERPTDNSGAAKEFETSERSMR
jgi:hypothetical protein